MNITNLDSHYDFEKQYWGNCCNTFDEDQKHYIYAKYMSLPRRHYSFILNPISIIDIGGGPTSILLKCTGFKNGLIVDPIEYPKWTVDRYNLHNVEVRVQPGELLEESNWDEVWIYNCLQHVEDVEKIIHNAQKAAKILRIFEWIDVPPHEGHPVELTKKYLDNCIKKYFSGNSHTVELAESGCYGKAYYGTFIK